MIIILKKVQIGDDLGQIKVYEDESFNLNVKTIQAHSFQINRIKQSPFNKIYVASCSNDARVNVWNSNMDWNKVQTYTGHSKAVLALDFINEDTIVSGGFDQTIQTWSISTGLTQRTIQVGSDVLSLKVLNNRFYVACGLGNGDINIYNINNGNLISILKSHNGQVFDLILINDGNSLVSSSKDGTLKIWNLITNAPISTLTGHSDWVIGLKILSPNIIASCSLDTTIKLWNTTSAQLIRTLKGHTSNLYWSLDLLDDGETLVSGSEDQTIKFWNWKTGQLLNSVNTGTRIYALNTITSNAPKPKKSS